MTTPTTPFEDKVRDAMQKYTEDIDPSPDALEKIKHASFVHVHRRAITGGVLAIAAAFVATLATMAAVQSAPSNHVAITPQTQPPVVTVAPPHKANKPTLTTTTPTSVAVVPSHRPPKTSTTTVPAPVDACPQNCLGRATADVDGDGRPDQIGLMQTQQAPANSEAIKLLVRVVFANGTTADYPDDGTLYGKLVGAADVNHDGRAEIFITDSAGAHSVNGKILRWNGTALAAVAGPDGKPFVTDVDSEATNYHDASWACEGNQFVTYDGGLSDKYTLTTTTYAWNGNELAQVSQKTTTYPGTDAFNPPSAIAHMPYGCPGLH
jgi:hypothetical protein